MVLQSKFFGWTVEQTESSRRAYRYNCVTFCQVFVEYAYYVLNSSSTCIYTGINKLGLFGNDVTD